MHRGMPSLNALTCGAKAHGAQALNSPSELKQFGRLMLHFAKRYNVSGMIRKVAPAATTDCLDVGSNTVMKCQE